MSLERRCAVARMLLPEQCERCATDREEERAIGCTAFKVMAEEPDRRKDCSLRRVVSGVARQFWNWRVIRVNMSVEAAAHDERSRRGSKGTTRVMATISNPAGRVREGLVPAGALASCATGPYLEAVELEHWDRRVRKTGNGVAIDMATGDFGDETVGRTVSFGAGDAEPSLGVTAAVGIERLDRNWLPAGPFEGFSEAARASHVSVSMLFEETVP